MVKMRLTASTAMFPYRYYETPLVHDFFFLIRVGEMPSIGNFMCSGLGDGSWSSFSGPFAHDVPGLAADEDECELRQYIT